MLRIKLPTFLLFALIGLMFTSCLKDDEPSQPDVIYKKSSTTAVTGPETAAVDQEISLNVAYTVDNECGAYHSFIEASEGFTRTIAVQSAYTGDCGYEPVSKTCVYKFKSAVAGTFTLKFAKSPAVTIDKVIVVE